MRGLKDGSQLTAMLDRLTALTLIMPGACAKVAVDAAAIPALTAPISFADRARIV